MDFVWNIVIIVWILAAGYFALSIPLRAILGTILAFAYALLSQYTEIGKLLDDAGSFVLMFCFVVPMVMSWKGDESYLSACGLAIQLSAGLIIVLRCLNILSQAQYVHIFQRVITIMNTGVTIVMLPLGIFLIGMVFVSSHFD